MTSLIICTSDDDEYRLTMKWHGEDSLVNSCDDHKQCSAYEHRQNRRAEPRIMSEDVAEATK